MSCCWVERQRVEDPPRRGRPSSVPVGFLTHRHERVEVSARRAVRERDPPCTEPLDRHRRAFHACRVAGGATRARTEARRPGREVKSPRAPDSFLHRQEHVARADVGDRIPGEDRLGWCRAAGSKRERSDRQDLARIEEIRRQTLVCARPPCRVLHPEGAPPEVLVGDRRRDPRGVRARLDEADTSRDLQAGIQGRPARVWAVPEVDTGAPGRAAELPVAPGPADVGVVIALSSQDERRRFGGARSDEWIDEHDHVGICDVRWEL